MSGVLPQQRAHCHFIDERVFHVVMDLVSRTAAALTLHVVECCVQLTHRPDQHSSSSQLDEAGCKRSITHRLNHNQNPLMLHCPVYIDEDRQYTAMSTVAKSLESFAKSRSRMKLPDVGRNLVSRRYFLNLCTIYVTEYS